MAKRRVWGLPQAHPPLVARMAVLPPTPTPPTDTLKGRVKARTRQSPRPARPVSPTLTRLGARPRPALSKQAGLAGAGRELEVQELAQEALEGAEVGEAASAVRRG